MNNLINRLTRRCVFCRNLEIPEAGELINCFWICPRCAWKIKHNINPQKEVLEIAINPSAKNP